jgi:hypothetical protein
MPNPYTADPPTNYHRTPPPNQSRSALKTIEPKPSPEPTPLDIHPPSTAETQPTEATT